MTDITTEAVERLINDATPGPWVSDPENGGRGLGRSWRVVQAGNWMNGVAETVTEGDAAFIAAARTLVPALLADRDRLAALLADSQSPDPATNADSCQPTRTYADGVLDAAAVADSYSRQPATGNNDHDAGWDNAAKCIHHVILELIKEKSHE